mmetsp:Transcript_31399/g.50502  ORF Transcript_31399/g.50502 Transcript_31399/m.50502 type:complete len:294 (-) Transcript_31399:99-980(-)
MALSGRTFMVLERPRLNKQNSIDATVHVRVVGHLGVLCPNDLAGLRDEAQLGDVHLNDRALRHDTEGGVQSGLRILLHANYVKAEGHLQLWMCDMRLLHPQRRWANIPLILGRLPREVIADEGDLVHHTLPSLLLSLATAKNLEHLILCHRLHLGNRHLPLPSFLFPLLLDHVGKNLGPPGLLTIQKVGWDGTWLHLITVFCFCIFLLVSLDGLFHGCLFGIPFLREELRLDATKLPGSLCNLLWLTSLFLSHALFMVKSPTISLDRLLDVLVLRHSGCETPSGGEGERKMDS